LVFVDISIRRATPADLPEIARQDAASFGVSYSEQDIADALLVVDLDRFWVATADDEIVGVTGDFPLTMTVPGGALVDVPGVTWVSVRPTHRRRGILSRLMEHQLRDYAERGESMAILTASEGGIYRRFGYGAASRVRRTVIDRRLARLLPAVAAAADGRVELVPSALARTLLPGIHERWRALTPGAINRSEGRWDYHFVDRDRVRDGMSEKYYLVHDDGYVAYRIKENWADGHPQHSCWITDYVAVTRQAHVALWQVLLNFDLVGTIESYQIPIDDPLPHLLTNGRDMRTTALSDGVWVRPLDVPATLAARRYALEVEAVLAVRDPLFGDRSYAVVTGPEGVECAPTDRRADLTLTVDALGSAYLGGERLTVLAAGGRVWAEDAAVLSRLDRAFLADRAPFHGTAF
jgi:predicted acetyltransferase